MRKLQSLGKREATSGVLFLQTLFKNPITNSSIVADTMKFSRPGANKLIERFTDLDILQPLNENAKWGKMYVYKKYIDIFNE